MLLQPAFILHARPYLETSALLEAFTEQGRIALVARGLRQRRSMLRSLLQPFVPLLISWRGRGELMNLISAEPLGSPIFLKGNGLLSGFYLNELLIHLLPKQDPCPQLFMVYHETLQTLQTGELTEKILRLFEKKLLIELGFGLPLQHDCRGEVLQTDAYYHFCFEKGFEKAVPSATGLRFKGASLLALAEEQLDEGAILRDIKYLMRCVFGYLLGDKVLLTRQLFI